MNSAPLNDSEFVDTLGKALRAADYTTGGIADLLGERAAAALDGGQWWPALHSTEDVAADRRALATLIRLFLVGSVESESDIAHAFPGMAVDELVAQQVIAFDDEGGRAILDIRPHGSDDTEYLVVADQDASMRSGPVAHDHVLGIGGASMSLAQAVIRTPVDSALDIGTGCGVQALHLSGHCARIVATDTNARALDLAAATARLNGLDWDLREGSLFEPVAGEQFDLIVSNPPFVLGTGAQDYIYRDSGMVGDDISRLLIEQIPAHLAEGGIAQILANWAVHDLDRWDERVRSWVTATGLDAWVVQRELADPVSYVSLWVSDAGETPEDAARRAARWLDWFDEQGIVGIGMGSICLRCPDAREAARVPEVIVEEITAAGQEVTGFEAQAFWARRDYLREHTDAQLLATTLTTAPVFLETQSLPGDDGWQQVGATVSRPGGPGAVLAVDEVLTALLAGCRGQLALSVLLDLLADFHGVDSAALAQVALPAVREAIGRGILYEAAD